MTNADFKHVLVATDFSEHAARALQSGIALAKKFDARLTLLHAFHLPPYAYDSAVVWPFDDLSRLGRDHLERIATDAKREFPQLESLFEVGYPAETIITTAKRIGADLIVLGTHGRRGLPRMLLGSVAEKIVRSAPVPVLTVSLPGQAA